LGNGDFELLVNHLICPVVIFLYRNKCWGQFFAPFERKKDGWVYGTLTHGSQEKSKKLILVSESQF
jgi:hypothetical protein